jgi:hypothetical protein
MSSVYPLLVLAILAAGLVAFQTRFGPGASGDSTSYLMGAENLLSGNGFSRYSGGYEIRPITGFPPFYSIVLAGLHALGPGLVGAARWLDVVLIGVNVLAVGWLVRARTDSTWAALIAQGLILAADSVFLWHTWVMSEPLYVTLMLIALIATVRFLDRQRRWWLVTAGLAAGLATLTRYVGLSLIVACATGVVALQAKAWRRRVEDAILLTAVSAAPVVLWFSRNVTSEGTLANRQWVFHGMDAHLVRLYLAEMSSWFVPHEVPLPTAVRAGMAILIALVLVGLFLGRSLRRRQIDWKRMTIRVGDAAKAPGLLWLLGGYILLYLAALAVNSLFLDASTTPGAVPRYLVPVFFAVVIFMVGSAHLAVRRRGGGYARLAGAAYVLLLLGFCGSNTFRLLRDPLSSIGYMGYKYRWPDAVSSLSSIDPGRVILTNNPEIYYVLTDHPAYVRPIRYDQYQDELRQDYQEQLEAAKARMEAGARLVIFRPIERADLDTIEFTGAHQLESFSQMAIYGVAK